jgi:hypothetical protein
MLEANKCTLQAYGSWGSPGGNCCRLGILWYTSNTRVDDDVPFCICKLPSMYNAHTIGAPLCFFCTFSCPGELVLF